ITEQDARNRSRKPDENQAGHHREQEKAAHDFNCSNDVAIERLRIHMAVAHGGQCLDAEKETIKKPMPASAACDAALLETVKRGEEKVECHVNADGDRGELRPSQAEQPAIDVAPSPCVGIDLDKLNLTGAERNGSRFPMHVYLMCSSW